MHTFSQVGLCNTVIRRIGSPGRAVAEEASAAASSSDALVSGGGHDGWMAGSAEHGMNAD